jgi:hypothetical protein
MKAKRTSQPEPHAESSTMARSKAPATAEIDPDRRELIMYVSI